MPTVQIPDIVEQFTKVLLTPSTLKERKRLRTLNPGLAVLEEYSSPMMPSNVHAVGKYAKKAGCCHIVRPITGHRLFVKYSLDFININLPGTMSSW